jgi:hypothetical protein
MGDISKQMGYTVPASDATPVWDTLATGPHRDDVIIVYPQATSPGGDLTKRTVRTSRAVLWLLLGYRGSPARRAAKRGAAGGAWERTACPPARRAAYSSRHQQQTPARRAASTPTRPRPAMKTNPAGARAQFWSLPFWRCSVGACIDAGVDDVGYIEKIFNLLPKRLSVDKTRVRVFCACVHACLRARVHVCACVCVCVHV